MKRWWLLAGCVALLLGCSEEPRKESKEPDWDRLTRADDASPKTSARTITAPAAETGVVVTQSTGQGGVTVRITPDEPAAHGCLRAVVQGQPGRAAYQWFVNEEVVPQNSGATLCSDYFKRDDEVSVSVGTSDVGASTTVVIGNTPPEIFEVTTTLDSALDNSDIVITVVGEDIDGDEVEYRYQWLINGEEDTLLDEATLPADSYVRGDKVEVVIVPFDGIDEGRPYRREVLFPYGPPRITSKPSQNFKTVEYKYQVVVKNASDAGLTYRLDDAPEGMEINSETGLVKWPLVGVTPGQYTVTIVVTDATGGETIQAFSLNLGAAE